MWLVAAGGWAKEVGGELKQKDSRPASPTIKACTDAPVGTSPGPGHTALTKARWGPGTELRSSFPSGVEPGAFACLPYCAQNAGEHWEEEPPHIRFQDSVLKSLKVNQINREHRALESRRPDSQGAATQFPGARCWWLVKRKRIQIGFWVKYS